MTVSLYAVAPRTFASMLGTLSNLLDVAIAKAPDADTLVEARLAPDMLPLAAQVRIACYQAMNCVARLTGGPRRR